MFIDTHCHLSNDDYENIKEVIEEAQENHVEKLIVCGYDKKSIKEVISISKEYKNVYLELGYHPSEANCITEEDIAELKSIVKNTEKIVAIGEIGLDYHWNKDNKENQKKLFKVMLKIAEDNNLPVVIHSRDAFQDTYDILKSSNVKGDIHCFSGNIENAKMYLDLGYYLGIGGVLTFKNTNLKDVVKIIPLERILLETDSPYLSPEPFRGKQNAPKNIPIIASEISKLKNIPISKVSNITTKNAQKLFKL